MASYCIRTASDSYILITASIHDRANDHIFLDPSHIPPRTVTPHFHPTTIAALATHTTSQAPTSHTHEHHTATVYFPIPMQVISGLL
jgi:hypothetical protein